MLENNDAVVQALLNAAPALEAGNGAAAPLVPIECWREEEEGEQEQQNSENEERRDEIERIVRPPLIVADAEPYPV